MIRRCQKRREYRSKCYSTLLFSKQTSVKRATSQRKKIEKKQEYSFFFFQLDRRALNLFFFFFPLRKDYKSMFTINYRGYPTVQRGEYTIVNYISICLAQVLLTKRLRRDIYVKRELTPSFVTTHNTLTSAIFSSLPTDRKHVLFVREYREESPMAVLKITIFRTVAQSFFIVRLPQFVSWSQGRPPEETISKRWGPVFESCHVQKGKMWLERCSPIMSCLCGALAQCRPAESSRIVLAAAASVFLRFQIVDRSERSSSSGPRKF